MNDLPKQSARNKLLDAATKLFRVYGFAATSVEALCHEAGVTKGAFFHYFKSKDDLGVAAAEYWSQVTGELFKFAPYHTPRDPLERIIAYIDFRKKILTESPSEYTCLVGTLVQETYSSSDSIREACKNSIFGHAETLEEDIQSAMTDYKVDDSWTARSLAQFFQATIQGAFVLAKASGSRKIVDDALEHLKRYVRSLFNTDTNLVQLPKRKDS